MARVGAAFFHLMLRSVEHVRTLVISSVYEGKSPKQGVATPSKPTNNREWQMDGLDGGVCASARSSDYLQRVCLPMI